MQVVNKMILSDDIITEFEEVVEENDCSPEAVGFMEHNIMDLSDDHDYEKAEDIARDMDYSSVDEFCTWECYDLGNHVFVMKY